MVTLHTKNCSSCKTKAKDMYITILATKLPEVLGKAGEIICNILADPKGIMNTDKQLLITETSVFNKLENDTWNM